MLIHFYCLIFYIVIIRCFYASSAATNDIHSEESAQENNFRKNVLNQFSLQETESPVRAPNSGLKIEEGALNSVPINQVSNQLNGRHFKIKKKAHPEGYSASFSDEKKSIVKNQKAGDDHPISGTKRQADSSFPAVYNPKDAVSDQRTFEDISKSYFRAGPPEHVGDSARLRFDFVRPASNGSCPNFQGSAEVVAGQWRLPPDVPVILAPDWTQGQMHQQPPQQPQLPLKLQSTGSGVDTTTISTTTTTMTATTSKIKKKGGFFKEIQDFIKHSLHMDKAKNSTDLITTSTPPNRLSEVAPSSLALQHPPLSDRISHGGRRTSGTLHGRNRSGFSKTKLRSLGGHREATFSLRIKAVAIPKLSENKMMPTSSQNEKGVSIRGTRTTADENIVGEAEVPSALKIYLKKVASFSGRG